MANDNEGKGPDPESLGHKNTKINHFHMIFDQGVINDAVLHHPYNGEGTEDSPYLVEWIPDDPRNPMDFSSSRRWGITLLVALATLAVAFVSSAYTGGSKQVIEAFNISTEVFTLGVSLFVLGFAIGPLLWAPLSELYGRQKLFFISYGALTLFNMGAALSQNIQTLLLMRFFAGAFGSSPLTNAGGVIADMFPASSRGLAMSVFAAAPFMGPTIGPIVGGFLGETKGWRWVEWLLCIFTGFLWLILFWFVPETYAPVLLQKRAAKLAKITGKHYISKVEAKEGKVEAAEAFKIALKRPWILLFREPIVLIISIYMAIIYGTLYMCFSAFPIVYQEGRGWTQGIGGLAFIGVAVGMMLGILISIPFNNRYQKVQKEHGGFAPPEARLPMALVGCVALPIGLFWFAWTNSPSIHWSVSIIGTAPFGLGMVLIFLSTMNYLIDAYTIFAASVLAANSVLRSLFGFAFPLFTTYMYQNLGIHWASSIPAFLALACVPAPFLFYKYGESIRRKCKYAAIADKFMKDMQAARENGSDDEDSALSGDDRDSEKSTAPASQMTDADAERRENAAIIEREEEVDATNAAFRTTTNLSTRSYREKAIRAARGDDYERMRYYETHNPYDIDRVNTRESFPIMERTTTNRSALSRTLSRKQTVTRPTSGNR